MKRFAPRKVLSLLLAFLTVLTGGGLLYLFGPWTHSAEAAWLDDNWLYRKAIPISTHTLSETNVYLPLTNIDTTPGSPAKFQSDCGDIRFTKQNGEILPYYIVSGCGGATTSIHVFFDSFPQGAQTIYMYYGNPNAPNGFSSSDFSTACGGGCTTGSVGSEENAPSPSAYWKFDEGQGTSTADSANQGQSSGGNTGTLSGASLPTWQTEDLCIFAKCLYFNGSSSTVTVASTIPGIKTVAMWVRPNSVASSALIDLDGGTHRITVSSGTISATGFSSPTIYVNGVVSSTLTANIWQYVVVTTATGFNTSSSLTIGKYGGGSQYLQGFLDEVKLYPTTRSAAQVLADYNARSNLKGASAVLGAQNQPAALSNGLVGYWRMDETDWTNDCTSTSVADSSGNTNNGKSCPSTTGPDPTTGKFGNGGNFDNTNDYIEYPDSTSLDVTTLTLAAWVKLNTDVTGTRTLIQKSTTAGTDGYSLDINSGLIRFCAAGGCASSSTSLSAGTWTHVAVTFDGTTTRFYKDGAPDGTSTAITSVPTNALVLRLGANSSSASLLNGVLDEARVYNRALSPADVATLYNWAPGPTAYYNFDEGSGSALYDRSGNGYNLSWNGTGTHYAPGKYGKAGQFNGLDDYLNSATASIPSQYGTASMWIYPKVAGSTYSMLSAGTGGNDFAMMQGAENLFGFYISAEYRIPATITANTWTHVSLTWDSSGSKLYFNGRLAGTNTNAPPAFNQTGFYIGTKYNNTRYLNGLIDELKIYKYARTQEQIIEDMNAGHPAPGSPVGSAYGYWKLEQGADNMCPGGVNDACNSGNGGSALDGAESGMAVPATSTSGWTNSGKFGKALVFDATNDYVDVGDLSGTEGVSQLTWSFWVKPATVATNQCLFCKFNNATTQTAWGIQTGGSSSSVVRVIIPTSTTDLSTYGETPTGQLSNGSWTHVLAVFDGSQTGNSNRLKVYINGVPQTLTFTGTIPASTQATTSNARFGASSDGARFYSSTIDEVKVYLSALTPSQVLTDLNHGSAQVFGALSQSSGSTDPGTAASQEYCIPGDSTSCAGPVGRWDFEEGSGTSAYDSSGNGNTGAITNDGSLNTSVWKRGNPCKLGKCLFFDAFGDKADVSDSTTMKPANITLSGWIYLNNATANGRIISRVNEDYLLNLETPDAGSRKLRFYLVDSGGTAHSIESNSGLTLNTWVNFEANYDGSIQKLYINGVQQTATSSWSGSLRQSTGVTRIGESYAGGNTLNGSLDHLMIFNYARSAAQVAWDYNRGAPVAWWKLDQCQGTTVGDSSGNGNSGTITIGGSGTQSAVGTCSISGTAWGNGATGKLNASLNFDGTDDYVSTSLTPSNIFSISYWYFANGTQADNTGLTSTYRTSPPFNGFYHSFPFSGAQECVWYDGNNKTCTSTLLLNQWVHTVIISNGSTISWYRNGKVLASVSGTTTHGNPLFIGRSRFNSDYFKGQMDDVRIYKYALTGSQVKLLYNDGAVRFGPASGTP